MYLLSPVVVLLAAAAAADPNPHNTQACTDCHREPPIFGVDTRKTVSFKGAGGDDPALCAPCHPAEQNLHPILVEAVKAGYLPLGTSPGMERKVVCTTCHFLHAADRRFALLRGFPGTADPRMFGSWQDFCGECHGANLAARSPHAGGGKLCAACHPVRPAKGRELHVFARGDGLCAFCHPKSGDLHYDRANPFGGRQPCVRCHDPHAGPDVPALLSAGFLAAARDRVDLMPHFRRALCFACHENLDDYALRAEDLNALCNRCHGSGEIPGNIHPLRKVPASITPPKGWPLEGGALTCLTCHEQGHEDQERREKLLRGGPYASLSQACRNCHDPDKFRVSDVHRDINSGKGCEFCHAGIPVVGKDTRKTVKFVADPDLPCYACHADPHPNMAGHYRYVDEARAATLPKDFFLFGGRRLLCATCHDPHITDDRGHKLREWVDGIEICTRCHDR